MGPKPIELTWLVTVPSPRRYAEEVSISPAELYPTGGGRAAFTLLDVRSPVEVERGALPGAHELPLLTNEERHAVGVRYKEAGQDAAVALGYELAGPALPARIAAWRRVCNESATAVACWRGGLRSRLAVELIDDSTVERVEGGYKAIRAHLMQELEEVVAQRTLLVLSGLTGSGKTGLLRSIKSATVQVIDLEHEAHHRGSSFGALAEVQPSQQTFENAVAASIVLGQERLLVVEDESRYIGRRTLPEPLLAAMACAPVVVLEAPLLERVANVYEEYVRAPAVANGVRSTLLELQRNTERLRKRLGGGRCNRVVAGLQAAESRWFVPEAHEGWIQELLCYYDRLYRKVSESRRRAVVFAGNSEDVGAWLTSRGATAMGAARE